MRKTFVKKIIVFLKKFYFSKFFFFRKVIKKFVSLKKKLEKLKRIFEIEMRKSEMFCWNAISEPLHFF